jgi:polysaccharide pyruvyl transferase WcaK-like protein
VKTSAADIPSLDLPDNAVIGVLGHYGNENLGDEASIDALIAQIRQRLPAARPAGFSVNPLDTAERFGIPAYPIRRGLSNRRPSEQPIPASAGPSGESADSGLRARLKSIPWLRDGVILLRQLLGAVAGCPGELRFLMRAFGQVRGLDLLMVAGSNQFLDNFGGTWGFPYTLLKWTLLARLSGTPVIFVCIGAGPLDRALSKRMICWALGLSTYVSFRDKASQQLLEESGYRGKSWVYPDLAFGLPGALGSRGGLTADAKLLVGINPMPVYDKRYWFVHDEGLYQGYVEQLAACAAEFMADGHQCILWSSQPRDELVIEDVMLALEARLGRSLDRAEMVHAPRSVKSLLDTLGQLDLSIATRFHGVVLSLWAGLPTVSICYYRKQNDVMEDLGQGGMTLAFEDLDGEVLLERFRELAARRGLVRGELETGVQVYRQALSAQFDGLFGAVGSRQDVGLTRAQWHQT